MTGPLTPSNLIFELLLIEYAIRTVPEAQWNLVGGDCQSNQAAFFLSEMLPFTRLSEGPQQVREELVGGIGFGWFQGLQVKA